MGAGSLLALMARHSLLSARQHSRLEVAKIALNDYEHVNHARLAEVEEPSQSAGALHLLSSFHVDLAERLQQLQLQGAGDAHLNWLLDALASTISTHASLQPTFTAAANSASASSANHHANKVLHLLDVCSALKQVADNLDRQLGCLQHALQSVGRAVNPDTPLSSGRLRAAAHRLSACLLQERSLTNILGITGKHSRPLAEARSSLLLASKRESQSNATLQDTVTAFLSEALDGAMLTSLLVLAAAVSSLAPPSRRKCSGTISTTCKMISKYLGAKSVSSPWAVPLRRLHHDLRQDNMSAAGGSLFWELQGLHLAANKLHTTITTAHSIDQLAVAKQSVESLSKSLRETQSCISMLRVQLASLFQALIALRLALLDS